MDLLILGASARAAASSAVRIGLRPTCVDLFADADLLAACPALRVEPAAYPDGLADLAETLTPLPWLYTGALENRPDLVDRVSDRHRLLGNPGATLRAARDPLALASAARAAGLLVPEVRLDPGGLPTDGSWLSKPLASAGGRGILPWLGRGRGDRRPSYYQKRVGGLPLSALYVGGASTARCLGITRQFVGKGANRFAYRGSLAPWPVGSETLERVGRLGEAVADRFGLVGLFGIDLILADGHPWPIELNPRYTASVEVLEWASGRSLLAEHLDATGPIEGQTRWRRPGTFAAKAIVFATRPFAWTDAFAGPFAEPDGFPIVADIPRPGTPFRPGEPVLTVFARGDSLGACRRALAARSKGWRHLLRGVTSPARTEGPP